MCVKIHLAFTLGHFWGPERPSPLQFFLPFFNKKTMVLGCNVATDSAQDKCPRESEKCFSERGAPNLYGSVRSNVWTILAPALIASERFLPHAVNCVRFCFSALWTFCLCRKYIRNRWMDLCQIRREDAYGPSLGRVWTSRSKARSPETKKRGFGPFGGGLRAVYVW